jgi:hypothetical protein
VKLLVSYSTEELKEMLTTTNSRGKKQRIKKILGIIEPGDEEDSEVTGNQEAP